MATSSDDHTWELYKENAAPLERGRNVAKLSKVLSSPPTDLPTKSKKDSDTNIQNFEKLIRPTERFSKYYMKKLDETNAERGHNGAVVTQLSDDIIETLLSKCKVDKDPIVHWLKYIKYHEESYPSDTHTQFLIMERCMHALFYMNQYKNDVRYIRVLVLYADKTSNPHEQFKSYHKHKIGEYVAIFWLAWAWVAEKEKDYSFAEKIFNKALQKGAKPTKVVQERHKQFLRRMSRHWLNQQQRDQHDIDGYDEYEEDERDNRRGALNGLTEEGVRQNNRARGVNSYHRVNNARQQGILTTRNGPSNTHDSDQVNGVDRMKPKSSFMVYTDENNNDDSGYDLNQSTMYENDENRIPLPRVVREKDKKKENTLSAEAWNERGGLHSNNFGYSDGDNNEHEINSSVARRWAGTGSDSIIAGGTSSQQAFQVFVDEDFCGAENDNIDMSSKMKRSASRGRANDRTLRQRLDDGTMTRKPLRTMSSSSDESSGKGESRFNSRKGLTLTSLKAITNTSTIRQSNPEIDDTKKPSFHHISKGEKCFEENRATLKYYTLANPNTNFNLLQRHNEDCYKNDENSDMDMDIASSIEALAIDEEEYNENESSQIVTDENLPPSRKANNLLNMTTFQDKKAPLSVTTLHGTICDSITKKSKPRKLFFDVNSSLENKSFISATNNTSAASSVCYNESEAVGVQGDKEETVNTKFAARELSMMFSSPAPNKSASGSKNQALSSSNKLLFSVHRSKHYVNESNDSSTAELNDSFNINRDYERISKHNNDDQHRSVFKIFEESSSQENSDVESPNRPGSESSSGDSSENSSKFGGDGEDTASLADIMDLMKGINNVNEETTVTEDIAAIGGDLSCILHNKDGDTIRLQEKVSQLDITNSS